MGWVGVQVRRDLGVLLLELFDEQVEHDLIEEPPAQGLVPGDAAHLVRVGVRVSGEGEGEGLGFRVRVRIRGEGEGWE